MQAIRDDQARHLTPNSTGAPFFGEASLRAGALRNASIVATSPVRILALSAHNIRVLHERIPARAEQIDLASADRRP